MKNVLVTGSKGFIGSHIVQSLILKKDINLDTFDRNDNTDKILGKDYIFHLAGVIKPKNETEYELSNCFLTKNICDKLESANQTPTIILSSSFRATCDTLYGISKRKSEQIIEKWAIKNKSHCIIYRLASIFGKNCKPNHTSVIATFCYNVSHNLPLKISDESRILEFIHIDDAVESLVSILYETTESKMYRESYPVYKISLGDLANMIRSFKTLKNIDFPNIFHRQLYETYISYIDQTYG